MTKTYAARTGEAVLSFDTFKACIDKIPRSVRIDFSGMCEPWLNDECTAMVLYAYQAGHRIGVFTTLVGLTRADLELLAPIPFYYFVVHLPSRDSMEYIDVDAQYLEVLTALTTNTMDVTFVCHGKDIPFSLEAVLSRGRKKVIKNSPLFSRAGAVTKIVSVPPTRKKGRIRCTRGPWFVLLPSGDVLLCCQDYCMRHVLGNLLGAGYRSLFCGEEYLKVMRGWSDESSEILCRYCEKAAPALPILLRPFRGSLDRNE